MFDRFDVCEAYHLYDRDWGPTEYGARLYRVKFRPAPSLSLETAGENVKEIYGRLVREHNRLYVGFERYRRRNSMAPLWPGTNHMRGGARAWLKSRGILDAVLSYVPEER